MTGKFSSPHFVSSLIFFNALSTINSAVPKSPCLSTYNLDTKSKPSFVLKTVVADVTKLFHKCGLFSNLQQAKTLITVTRHCKNTDNSSRFYVSRKLVRRSVRNRIQMGIKWLWPRNLGHEDRSMVLAQNLPGFDGRPILLQKVEQRCIPITISCKHTKNERNVTFCEVPILLQNSHVQQTLELPWISRTTRQRLQQISPLVLPATGWEVNNPLQTKFPFLPCTPFKHGADVLIGHPKTGVFVKRA